MREMSTGIDADTKVAIAERRRGLVAGALIELSLLWVRTLALLVLALPLILAALIVLRLAMPAAAARDPATQPPDVSRAKGLD